MQQQQPARRTRTKALFKNQAEDHRRNLSGGDRNETTLMKIEHPFLVFSVTTSFFATRNVKGLNDALEDRSTVKASDSNTILLGVCKVSIHINSSFT